MIFFSFLFFSSFLLFLLLLIFLLCIILPDSVSVLRLLNSVSPTFQIENKWHTVELNEADVGRKYQHCFSTQKAEGMIVCGCQHTFKTRHCAYSKSWPHWRLSAVHWSEGALGSFGTILVCLLGQRPWGAACSYPFKAEILSDRPRSVGKV